MNKIEDLNDLLSSSNKAAVAKMPKAAIVAIIEKNGWQFKQIKEKCDGYRNQLDVQRLEERCAKRTIAAYVGYEWKDYNGTVIDNPTDDYVDKVSIAALVGLMAAKS